MLIGGFFLNHIYIDDSVVLQIFICIAILLWMNIRTSKKVTRMTEEEALKYLKNKLEVKK